MGSTHHHHELVRSITRLARKLEAMNPTLSNLEEYNKLMDQKAELMDRLLKYKK